MAVHIIEYLPAAFPFLRCTCPVRKRRKIIILIKCKCILQGKTFALLRLTAGCLDCCHSLIPFIL